MKKTILKSTRIALIAAIFSLGVSAAFAATWTPPTGTPPTENTLAPINVGTSTQSSQTKLGNFIVNGNLAAGGYDVNGAWNGIVVKNGGLSVGTTDTSAKLSVLGNIAILRDLTQTLYSPGSELSLQSWSTNTTPQYSDGGTELTGSEWAAMGDGTPGDKNTKYSCPPGSGGNTYYNDLFRTDLGGGAFSYAVIASVTCNAATDKYSFRTNRGDLEFLNSSNLLKFVLGQAGGVGIGTTGAPTDAKLEVNGQIKITGGSKGVGKVLTSNADGLATWENPGAAGITGAASSIATNNLAANRVLISDVSGKVSTSTITDVKLSYLTDVNSAIQSQIDAKASLAQLNLKASTSNPVFTGKITTPEICLGAGAGVCNTTWPAGGAGGVSDQWYTVGNNLYSSTTLGNVGIGTSTPAAKLDVNGNVRSNRFYDAFGAGASQGFFGTYFGINGSGSYDPTIWTNSGKILLANGNVGIGTLTPKNKLDVKGGVAIGDYAGVLPAAPDNSLIVSGKIGVGLATLDNFGLQVVGNVKIQTAIDTDMPTLVLGNKIDGDSSTFSQACTPVTDPTKCGPNNNQGDNFDSNSSIPSFAPYTEVVKKLCNEAKAGQGGDFIDVGKGKIGDVIGYIWRDVHCEAADVPFYSLLNDTGVLKFTNSGNEVKFALDQSGNVGIGTISPVSKLSVSGGSAIGTAYNATAVSDGNLIVSGNVGIGTTTPAVKLEVVGDVNATAYYYSSDRSLKTAIKPLSGSLDKILQLQGVSFNWKADNKTSVGLIAQDVEKIFPELVLTNKYTGMKSVEYGNLVAPLIESVKEQQNKINKLESLVGDLQKQIDLLKK